MASSQVAHYNQTMDTHSKNASANTHADCDVLIVGAGLVGASLALRLADSGLRIGLLDRGDLAAVSATPQPTEGSGFDPRVVALTARSQQLLEQLGAWQLLKQQRLCPYEQMRVWEEDGTGQVEFSAGEIHAPALGTIVENSLVLNALLSCLDASCSQAAAQRREAIRLFPQRSVTALERSTSGRRLLTTLRCDDGSEVSAHLVVAADGGNSRLRELAGFETREWDYGQKAIVTTIRTREPHALTALQRFLNTGPLAYLPLADGADAPLGKHCSIVWSADSSRADELMALGDEGFAGELNRAMEGAFGGVEAVDSRFVFPLRQRHAKRYVQDNIILAGDAAHTIHPLAGQGVNLGFLDVQALAEALEAGLAGGRHPEDSLMLQRYQRQRMGPNLAMMALMEGFKRGFADQPLALRWLRNVGLKGVNRFAALRKALASEALGA